jgi:hypothetical protein
MKKHLLLLIISFMSIKFCASQNLVLNGDFEQYNNCPQDFDDIDSATFWTQPTIYGTSDFFDTCSYYPSLVNVPNTFEGFQQSHSGGGFAGLELISEQYSNNREYMEGTFSSPLNSKYHWKQLLLF